MLFVVIMIMCVPIITEVAQVAFEIVQCLRLGLEHLTGHVVCDAHHAQRTCILIHVESGAYELSGELHGTIVDLLHGRARVITEQHRDVLRTLELALIARPAEQWRPHQSTNTLVHDPCIQLAANGHER